MPKLSTTSEFISKAKNIHNSTYDYSLVEYKNAHTKVKIICPTHGTFEQRPSYHLNGSGCPVCFGTQKLTLDDFIQKSKTIHDDKYSYFNYINMKTKIKIKCNACNSIFEQKPIHHITGSGCAKCGYEKNAHDRSSTLSEFIRKANKIHNNKYDYSLSEYKNNHTKVKIMCPYHGVFEQSPMSHLDNKGCSKCKSSKGELKIEQFLISNHITFIHQKRFKECRDLKPLPFDFYLSEHNICIEYDGQQHYSPINFTGHLHEDQLQIRFQRAQDHDLIKNKFCKDNHIKLIRIPFNESKNIETILTKLLLN